MAENELTIDSRSDDDKLVENAKNSTAFLLANCPNPSQAEIRKLLAIQGYLLQQVGLDLLAESRTVKRGDNKVVLALKALAASREALKNAAVIEIEEKKEND